MNRAVIYDKAVDRQGWVPIGLKRQSGEVVVEWSWLGETRFADPFFDNTIEMARRSPFNALFTHRSPIAELEAWQTLSPGLAPAGFIFHMSRCGSTLISQMLAAMPESIVISEACPIDWLARAAWIPEPIREESFRWMVSALGQKRSGLETRYFIKFDSLTVTALPLIRRAFPDVPWIFVYRDPGEVLISHQREPAAAMSRGVVTDCAVIEGSMAEVLSMSEEEYSARVIGRLCECARLGMDGRGLLVNYRQLPGAVCEEIARHFGIRFSAADVEAMLKAATHDAKRPRRTFEPDCESKQREVSDTVRAAAARWIAPHYEELERLRSRQGADIP